MFDAAAANFPHAFLGFSASQTLRSRPAGRPTDGQRPLPPKGYRLTNLTWNPPSYLAVLSLKQQQQQLHASDLWRRRRQRQQEGAFMARIKHRPPESRESKSLRSQRGFFSNMQDFGGERNEIQLTLAGLSQCLFSLSLSLDSTPLVDDLWPLFVISSSCAWLLLR